MSLVEQRREARRRLDTITNTLQRSIDLREQLQWGILDMDDAIATGRGLQESLSRTKGEKNEAA